MVKTVWIDVETTGLDSKADRIIELAAIYDPGGLVYHGFCRPFEQRPEGFDKITEITGIEWEGLEAHGMSDTELYRSFKDWLRNFIDPFDKGDKAIFAGYNAAFDNRFVRELFARNGDPYFGSLFLAGSLDVLSTIFTTARFCAIDLRRLADFKLGTVAEHFGFTFKAHSASEDIRVTRLIQEQLERSIHDN